MSFSEEDRSFDYGLDDFHSDGEEDGNLSWRLDGEESMSDWTLVVTKSGSHKEDTYHVHKAVLGVGPCKSDYFASVFRNQHMVESQTSTSRIVLEDSAAKAIPHMLDFVYSRTHELTVSAENALSLRYLAQYFGCKLLHRKVISFIRDDMNIDNLHLYFTSAKLFHDARMQSLSSKMCVDNIQRLTPTSKIIQVVDADFFFGVISSPQVDTCNISCHLSKLVASYCQYHRADLDSDQFEKLTDRKYIPLISKDAALDFLDLASSINADSSMSICLQRRCISVLAQNWKEIKLDNSLSFGTLNSEVISELFKKTLTAAKKDVDSATNSVKLDIDNRVSELNQELQTSLNTSHDRVQQLERQNRRLTNQLDRMRLILDDRNREIVQYQNQWSKMQRVPVSHVFRDTKRCTYRHESPSEPFDSPQQARGRYGKARPTAMPSIGDSSEDGYLYLQKNGQIYERWPVFYYKDR